MDWVTDPKAIDTLVALGGLRVGDEIRVQHCRNIMIETIDDGAVVCIANADPRRDHPWVDKPPQEEPSRKVACVFSDGMYVYARENIAAWRRPGVPKE